MKFMYEIKFCLLLVYWNNNAILIIIYLHRGSGLGKNGSGILAPVENQKPIPQVSRVSLFLSLSLSLSL